MAQKHTLEELNNCSREELITIVLMMQGQLDALNDNIEKLIEQVRIANNYRFGRHTESLKSIGLCLRVVQWICAKALMVSR